MHHIRPMVVAVWCGVGKPSVLNDFFGPFVTELNHLIKNPILINTYQITVCFRCFICDTPARAFIKGELLLTHQISDYF